MRQPDYPWHAVYERYGINTDIEIPSADTSLLSMIEESCQRYAGRVAFTCMGVDITYAQLNKQSTQVAAFLQSIGLQKGDKIAVMLPNILQYPVIVCGILKAGMVLVNINPLYTANELSYQLENSDAKALFIFDLFTKNYFDIADEKKLDHIFVCQMSDFLGITKSLMASYLVGHKKRQAYRYIANSLNYPDILRKGEKHPYTKPIVMSEDIALLQYTGGTTGRSKGAMLTHGNLCANMRQVDEQIKSAFPNQFEEQLAGDLIQQDTVLAVLPIYHVFSMLICCFYSMHIGYKSLLITDPRNIKRLVKQLRQYKPAFIAGVNTLFEHLLAHPDFEKLDFSYLKASIGGGAAISNQVAKKWEEVTAMPIIQGYGMSETSPIVAFNPLTIGSFDGKVGVPAPSTHIVLLDKNNNPVANGERGEICVKGPQVMVGYYKDEALTKQSFTKNGYFRTGDIGIINDKGYIQIVDRIKDMIVVSGFNVYPNEIEAVMQTHPAVEDCAVIGVPSKDHGEEPKLYVVANKEVTAEALLVYGEKNLTGYKRPRQVQFIDELPKSNIGKTLRIKLRKMEGLI